MINTGSMVIHYSNARCGARAEAKSEHVRSSEHKYSTLAANAVHMIHVKATAGETTVTKLS